MCKCARVYLYLLSVCLEIERKEAEKGRAKKTKMFCENDEDNGCAGKERPNKTQTKMKGYRNKTRKKTQNKTEERG